MISCFQQAPSSHANRLACCFWHHGCFYKCSSSNLLQRP